jgi:hypothetical protein
MTAEDRVRAVARLRTAAENSIDARPLAHWHAMLSPFD